MLLYSEKKTTCLLIVRSFPIKISGIAERDERWSSSFTIWKTLRARFYKSGNEQRICAGKFLTEISRCFVLHRLYLWGITPVFPSLSLLDDPRSTVICIAGNTSHNVSFEKDITAGVFTSLDTANSIESCVRRACNRRDGDMTFLVGKSCFMVRCYSPTSCKIVKPSSPSSVDISITPYTWFGRSQLTEFSCLANSPLCGYDTSSSLQACVYFRQPVKLLPRIKLKRNWP